MNKRAMRIINAFINCVNSGVMSLSYAITLLEDESKYGYLSDDDKEIFYASAENKNE